MRPWKTIARQTILDRAPFLTVEDHTVQLPDGRVIEGWSWIDTPDYINVVAVTEEGSFLFFRQTKYGIEGTSLAPVGGYLNGMEEPLSAARRELLEETGYEATQWASLGSYTVDGNRGAGTAHFFLATGAQRVAEPDADDLEEQELRFLTRAEVEHALDGGEFKVLGWTTVVALSLRRLCDGGNS